MSKDDTRVARFEGDKVGAAAAAVSVGLLNTSEKENDFIHSEKTKYSGRFIVDGLLIPKIIFIAIVILGFFALLNEGSKDIPKMIKESIEYKEIDSDLLFMTLLVCIPTLILIPFSNSIIGKNIGGWFEGLKDLYFTASFLCGIIIIILEIFLLKDGILTIIVGLMFIPLIVMILPTILIFLISKCPRGIGIIVWILTLLITLFMIIFGLIPIKKNQQAYLTSTEKMIEYRKENVNC